MKTAIKGIIIMTAALMLCGCGEKENSSAAENTSSAIDSAADIGLVVTEESAASTTAATATASTTVSSTTAATDSEAEVYVTQDSVSLVEGDPFEDGLDWGAFEEQ